MSAKLVYSNEFIDKAKRILAETGIPRNRLIFEVTESATIDDPSKNPEPHSNIAAASDSTQISSRPIVALIPIDRILRDVERH